LINRLFWQTVDGITELFKGGDPSLAQVINGTEVENSGSIIKKGYKKRLEEARRDGSIKCSSCGCEYRYKAKDIGISHNVLAQPSVPKDEQWDCYVFCPECNTSTSNINDYIKSGMKDE
jgi:Zn finger protein HypA/HybF involved in hydrogenase expression